MPSASLRRVAVTSLGLFLAALVSHAMRAQQAGPALQPVGPTGTIAGRVVNAATGAPAAGLDVTFQNDVGRKVATATTDAGGRYASPPLPVGDYYVRTASLNPLGLVPQFFDKIPAGRRVLLKSWDEMKQCTAVTVTANRVTGGIDFALEPGGAITGIVRNAVTGERVPKARVWAGGVETVADADGAYRITGLPSGTHQVGADASDAGLLPALYPANPISGGGTTREPVATVMVKAPAVTAGIDIALQPGGTITGRVTDKATGAPIPGVTITAGRGTGTTNANGDYSIRGLPTGSFTVLSKAPATSAHIDQLYDGIRCWRETCDLKLGTLVKVTAPETIARIDFHLQRGAQIAGRITNAATGAPVADARVIFEPAPPGQGASTSTDAQGRYVSPGLLPGPYYVHTDGPNQVGMFDQVYPGKPFERRQTDARSGTPVTAVEGSTTGGIDFALVEGGSISGVVTQAGTGAPIRGVRIGVYSPSTNRYGVTDGAGRYRVAGLRTGSYRVSATPAWEGALGLGMKHAMYLESLLGQAYGAKDAATSEPEAGTPIPVTAPVAVTGIDFALVKGGVITGTVVNARTGEPVAGVGMSADGPSSLQVSTDDSGRYELTGLESGTYTVKTSVEASRSARPPLPVMDQVYNGIPCRDSLCTGARGTPIPVTAGRTTPNIDFSLAEGGVISGVVTDAATGKPAVWARVSFYSPDGKQVDTADAAANGRYMSGGLPAGTYLAVAAVQDPRSSLAPQVYKGRPCAPPTALKCDPKGGTPIVVTAPGSTTGIDFALASGGTISGAVTVAATGKPVPGARVAVHSGPMEAGFAANATADQDGRYQVSGLPGGTYYVRAVPPDTTRGFDRTDPAFAGLLDQVYPGVGCTSGACEPRVKGEPVVVGMGTVVTGVDFRLRPGATVSGRVTDASSGEAVNRATVYFHAASGVVAGSARSDFEGKYASSPLPPGQYYLRIEPPDEAPLAGALHPAVPYWLGDLSVKSGAPVTVEEGGVVTGRDFALAPGGVIRGKVTWADSGKRVQYFAIRVYTQGGVLAAKDNALARLAVIGDGTYAIPALPPGKYYVTTADGEEHGYIDQVYRAVACPREACRPTDGTPVIVGGPDGVSGIDFALEPGPARDLTKRLADLPAGRHRIEPDSGPASGGSLVTISGGPFDYWRTKVLIGGVPAVSVEWRRLRSLTVVVPPGKPGPADIVVTTPEGSQVLPKGFTYVADQPAAPVRRR